VVNGMNMDTLRKTAAAGVLAVVVLLTALPCPSTAAETYQHDAIGRLTDVQYANGGSLHYTYDANGNVLSILTAIVDTGVDGSTAPLKFTLGLTTPNPASGPRSLAFTIPARGHVTLRVFDVSGREAATLYDRTLDPGRYTARFSTDRWASGVYFYRLALSGRVLTGRLVVLR
jgi:YD repeat-containing protein